ncbi:MAG: eight-cysteine-cluster domain-containing protein [Pyrobaculum sp.]
MLGRFLVMGLAVVALVVVAAFVWHSAQNKRDVNNCPSSVGFCGISTNGPCESDADCLRDGCSGQVCRSVREEPVVTTCEWRDCYDAEKYKVACKCVNGMCQWAAVSTKP